MKRGKRHQHNRDISEHTVNQEKVIMLPDRDSGLRQRTEMGMAVDSEQQQWRLENKMPLKI